MSKALLLFVLFLCVIAQTMAQSSSASVSFCEIPVKDDLRVGHANFSITMSFRLDENSSPTQIKKVSGPTIEENLLKSCMTKWSLRGLDRNPPFFVQFRWEHLKGWTKMRLFSRDLEIEFRR